MWCIVNLPNGTQNHAVKCDPKSCGQECLEKVCKALGIICEMEYFGLEHWQPTQKESRTHQWINLRNRLSQDCGSSSGIQLMLALRVKFWVPVHLILQETVRNLFYMQAKSDLLEGRLMPKDWQSAARLSALLCQADGIRFNEASIKAKCPIRSKLLEQQLLHQQQQQNEKQRKDKELPVLAFKKRRLSKQKSIESFDMPSHIIASTSIANTNNTAAAAASSSLQNHQLGAAASTILTTTPATIMNSSINSSSINCSQSQYNNTLPSSQCIDESSSSLKIYEDYLIRPSELDLQQTTTVKSLDEIPDDFLRKIAIEHGKLAKLKMSSKSAKYWLLQEIQELPGYGEEMFSGVTTIHDSSLRCDIAVGAHGITVTTGDEKNCIPFSAIAAAKSFRRIFKLEYVNDHNERKDLEIKLPKHCIAAGLYRSITERHAFYVCDKVRGVVTNQFTRDLKGTIASMFKEDTELGKRYVFDIQMTCREVHDQARRILYERGIELLANVQDEFAEKYLPILSNELNAKVDEAIKEKEDRDAVIERCVGTRITEAMTCKICMDREINSMINPCGHVTACSNCAAKCDRCPICRIKITNIIKIFLPTELRVGENDNNKISGDNNSTSVINSTSSCSSNNVTSAATTTTITTAAITSTPASATKTNNNNNNSSKKVSAA